MDNSEVYFIGENFTGGNEDLVVQMLEKLKNKTTHVPIYKIDDLNPAFLDSVYAAAKVLTDGQIAKIESNLTMVQSIMSDLSSAPRTARVGARGGRQASTQANWYQMARDRTESDRTQELNKWYADHRISRIRAVKRLDMIDAFKQNKEGSERR